MIGMAGETLCPLRWSDYQPFTGSFDGQGHVIRNLTDKPSRRRLCGFIRYIDKAGEIANLGIEGGMI